MEKYKSTFHDTAATLNKTMADYLLSVDYKKGDKKSLKQIKEKIYEQELMRRAGERDEFSAAELCAQNDAFRQFFKKKHNEIKKNFRDLNREDVGTLMVFASSLNHYIEKGDLYEVERVSMMMATVVNRIFSSLIVAGQMPIGSFFVSDEDD